MAAVREAFRIEADVWLMGHYIDSEHTWLSEPGDTCIREFNVVITEDPSHVDTMLHMVDGQEEMVFGVPAYVTVVCVQARVRITGGRDLPEMTTPLAVGESFLSVGTMHITDANFAFRERKE